MSFFSDLLGVVTAGFGHESGTSGAVAREVLRHMQGQQSGGLSALISQLTSRGLGDVVQSWVGTGPNKEVSPDQLARAMDPKLLEQLAAKFGISPQAVTAHLADVLPKVVDRLTPDGKIPEESGAEAEEHATVGAEEHATAGSDF